jgi:hypothetical protein
MISRKAGTNARPMMGTVSKLLRINRKENTSCGPSPKLPKCVLVLKSRCTFATAKNAYSITERTAYLAVLFLDRNPRSGTSSYGFRMSPQGLARISPATRAPATSGRPSRPFSFPRRYSFHPPPSARYSVTWLLSSVSRRVMRFCCEAYIARCESSTVRKLSMPLLKRASARR